MSRKRFVPVVIASRKAFLEKDLFIQKCNKINIHKNCHVRSILRKPYYKPRDKLSQELVNKGRAKSQNLEPQKNENQKVLLKNKISTFWNSTNYFGRLIIKWPKILKV